MKRFVFYCDDSKKTQVIRARRIDSAVTLFMRYLDKVRPWQSYMRPNDVSLEVYYLGNHVDRYVISEEVS